MSVIFYDAAELAQYAHRGADPKDLALVSIFNALTFNYMYCDYRGHQEAVSENDIRVMQLTTVLNPKYHPGGGLAYNLIANDGKDFAENNPDVIEALCRIEDATRGKFPR
jgi:hypothetical protein